MNYCPIIQSLSALAIALGTFGMSGLLPNLADVDVYAVGAGGKNAEQMARIHKFWSAFFEATHAWLRAYGRTPVPLLDGTSK